MIPNYSILEAASFCLSLQYCCVFFFIFLFGSRVICAFHSAFLQEAAMSSVAARTDRLDVFCRFCALLLLFLDCFFWIRHSGRWA